MEIQIHCKYDRLVPIEELEKLLNPENTNTHPEEQVDELIQQFLYQGVRHPAIISHLSGVMTAGEGRFLAAKKMGMKVFPAVWQEFASLEHETAFGVADNEIQRRSLTDLKRVNSLVEGLGPDFNIDRLGIKGFTIDVSEKYDALQGEGADEPHEALKFDGDGEGRSFHIVHGDCLEMLKAQAANSVDSLVTDPPAGISFMGKEWDDDKGGSKQWIAWLTDVMREALRVLKPGGHGLVWAIPRTSHWTGQALEAAGFEVRDIVSHLFGSGFPKSLDVSKAIDKAAGAEREVIGTKKAGLGTGGINKDSFSRVIKSTEVDVTTPTTPEAKQWSGWGTALKPAMEIWWLVRKPLDGTIAETVLKHGTGALNIDKCRIGNPPGRFPANLVLSHSANCRDTGTVGTVGTGEFKGPNARERNNGLGLGTTDKRTGKSGAPDSYGTETVPIWDCDPECPVAMLDAQSGNSEGGVSRFFYCAKPAVSERQAGLDAGVPIWEGDVWQKQDLKLALAAMLQLALDISEDYSMDENSWSTDLFGHSVSEQYPKGMIFTISTVLKLITALKTWNASQSLSISESIQDAIKTIEANGLSLAASVEFTNQLEVNTTSEKTAYLLGVVRAALPMLLQIKGFAKSGNFHSTVKPVTLMRYFCRLITPPGGLVLDPFTGSGTTGIGALAEGFDFLGFEQDQAHHTTAIQRIASAFPKATMPGAHKAAKKPKPAKPVLRKKKR